MTKTYAYDGIVSGSFLFKAGKHTMRATFDGGIIDDRRYRPATLTTSNTVAMLIIENTPEYRGGTIKVIAQSDDATSFAQGSKPSERANASPAEKKSGKNKKHTYDDVTTVGDAVNVLMGLGANASQVQDPISVLDTASAMGIVFPNLKLTK